MRYLSVIKRSIVCFIPFFLIVTFFCSIKYNKEYSKEIKLIEIRQKNKLDIIKHSILNHFESVFIDLMLLTQNNAIEKFIADPGPENKILVAKNFKKFLKFKRIYGQIKLIDKKGNEVLRIKYNEGNPVVVCKDSIAEKGLRDYFKAAVMLDKNEFYVSDIVFDDENYKIDEPTKAVIRLIAPIYKEDNKQAYIVVNYFAKEIIERIINFAKGELNCKICLFDNSEHIIIDDKKSSELSYFFGKKNEHTVKEKWPKEIWKVFFNKKSGSILTDKSIISFNEIEDIGKFFTHDHKRRIISKKDKNFYWKLAIIFGEYNFLEFKKVILKNNFLLCLILYFIIFTSITITVYLNSKKKLAEKDLVMAGHVFQNAKEGIMITDQNNNIIYINKSFSLITGYDQSEIFGKNPSYLKSDKHSPEFYRSMWENLNKFGKWQGEVWDKKKNGEIYPKWLSISIIKGEKKENTKYIGIFDDLTNEKNSEENIQKLTNYDTLTNLPNKLLYKDRLTQAVSNAKYNKSLLVIMTFDIDDFKYINDSYGYKKGDKLIIEFVNVIKNQLSETETFSRLEGNLFSIIFPSIKNLKDAAEKAKELLGLFKKPLKVDEKEIFVSLSIGIVIFPDDGKDADILIKNSSMALHYAKMEGKNLYKFYSKELNKKITERVEVEALLRRAVENNEFKLVYQPQVDIETHEIVGAEALVRWDQPDLGIIPPYKFIPIAEQTGLIHEIGHWVLENACKANKEFQDQNLKKIRISVNISPLQFKDPKIAENIKTVLDQTGLDSEYLGIEITESLLMHSIDMTIEKLARIRDMNVTISIDDFGTGYSSLSYIKKFPVSSIKIDRAFVKDYPYKDDGAIAKIVAQLAHNLNLKCVAEGVETEKQLKFMEEIGCQIIQGYYFSPPLYKKDFITVLKKGFFKKS